MSYSLLPTPLSSGLEGDVGNGIIEVCASDLSGEERVGAETLKVFDVPVSARKRRAIVKALTEKAAAGDVQATAFLFDRMYGRPGVAAKASAAEGPEMVRLDVRRLDEEEM